MMLINELADEQRGVFSKADLQTAFAEPHPSAFVRRVNRLEQLGTLRRFTRGCYVIPDFHLPTLSRRMVPDSYVSFEWCLARALVIGPRPTHRLVAVRTGKARSYSGLGSDLQYVSVSKHLFFGFDVGTDGVRYADPEKATLDALYFHLRGRRYSFDIYSDLQIERLNLERLSDYLSKYKNPKFRAFVLDVLGMR